MNFVIAVMAGVVFIASIVACIDGARMAPSHPSDFALRERLFGYGLFFMILSGILLASAVCNLLPS